MTNDRLNALVMMHHRCDVQLNGEEVLTQNMNGFIIISIFLQFQIFFPDIKYATMKFINHGR